MKFTLILLIAQTVLTISAESIDKQIVIKKCERTIDIATQLVRITAKVEVENTGSNNAQSILFAVEPELASNLAYITAQDKKESSLKVKPVVVSERKNDKLFSIDMKSSLGAGKSASIEVEMVFSQSLTPFPTHITQQEHQLVVYKGNHYLYSPYTVLSDYTIVSTGTMSIESYTKTNHPTVQHDTELKYGPYSNIKPFTAELMSVHYENNNPFLVVTSMDRLVELSHWGNIAIEETVDMRHTGAVLKGSFSRYEYQREQNSGISSVKSFRTVLPAAAKDVYYRDEIGNISTSHMKVLTDAVEIELRPRFPLFGGWKTHYTIGYNVPSYEYLYYRGDDYVLKIRFIDHVHDDMSVEEAKVRVLLPEGAHSIKVVTPYTIERLPDTKFSTYLDVSGRTVVNLRKTNIVENHIQDFVVEYKFSRVRMLNEPLMVVVAFLLLFMLIIFYTRLDFTISKDEHSESKQKLAGYCEKVQEHYEKRKDIYSKFTDALVKFKSSKDQTGLNTTVKNLNSEHKKETQAITELIAKMKENAPEVSDKLNELQKFDRNVKELIQQQITLAEKLVGGKLQKQQYLDQEGKLNKQKEDHIEKMDNIVSAL